MITQFACIFFLEDHVSCCNFFVGGVRKTTAACGVRNFRGFPTHATRASNSFCEKKLEQKNQLLGIKLLLTV